jgi:hypothetical protein
MKNPFIATIFYIVTVMLLSNCYAARSDGPYRGRVIDADTREPIKGVVVLGTWDREIITPGGAVHKYYDAMETVTDRNGNFEIKGLGLLVVSNVIPMDVLIFKAGYEYESGSWRGLKSRGWIGNEENYDPVLKVKVRRAVFDQKMKVKWEGDRAIIPLRKLTMEERKKSVTFPPSPSFQAPNEKVRMMMDEIQKERKERGLD